MVLENFLTKEVNVEDICLKDYPQWFGRLGCSGLTTAYAWNHSLTKSVHARSRCSKSIFSLRYFLLNYYYVRYLKLKDRFGHADHKLLFPYISDQRLYFGTIRVFCSTHVSCYIGALRVFCIK